MCLNRRSRCASRRARRLSAPGHGSTALYTCFSRASARARSRCGIGRHRPRTPTVPSLRGTSSTKVRWLSLDWDGGQTGRTLRALRRLSGGHRQAAQQRDLADGRRPYRCYCTRGARGRRGSAVREAGRTNTRVRLPDQFRPRTDRVAVRSKSLRQSGVHRHDPRRDDIRRPSGRATSSDEVGWLRHISRQPLSTTRS